MQKRGKIYHLKCNFFFKQVHFFAATLALLSQYIQAPLKQVSCRGCADLALTRKELFNQMFKVQRKELLQIKGFSANYQFHIRVEPLTENRQTLVVLTSSAFDFYGNQPFGSLKYKIYFIPIITPKIESVFQPVCMINQICANGRFHPSSPLLRVRISIPEINGGCSTQQSGIIYLIFRD